MKDIVIIGSGPAGLTAAIYAARANLQPVVISGNLPGGLLTQTTEIENFPGFPDGIQGFDLMTNIRKQAEKFDAEILTDRVTNLETAKTGHKLTLANGDILKTKVLIITTGAVPRWLGLESEDRLKNKGVSACATCDGAFYRGVPVIVVGGGDTAVEEACFLTKFASKVIMIHRRDKLRASKIMAQKALDNPKIEILWDTVVDNLNGDLGLESVDVSNIKTGKKSNIEAEGFFVALGHVPMTKLFKDAGIKVDEQGYIIVEPNRTETNIKGIFAAGDCVDSIYQQAIVAAGMGCKAAMDAENYLEEG